MNTKIDKNQKKNKEITSNYIRGLKLQLLIV